MVKLLESGENKSEIKTEIQIIKLGEFKLISIPRELFTQLELDITNGEKNIWIVSNANDYVGYIPTYTAYKEGGYEVIPWQLSKLKPGTGEKIRDEALLLLNTDSI